MSEPKITLSEWANSDVDSKKRLSGNSRQRRKIIRARRRAKERLRKLAEVLMSMNEITNEMGYIMRDVRSPVSIKATLPTVYWRKSK